jgi:hypothetical protein
MTKDRGGGGGRRRGGGGEEDSVREQRTRASF